MAEVILMGRRTEHQHVCSTYRSRTKPTAQTNAAIRAANVTTFSSPNIVRNPSTDSNLYIVKTVKQRL